MKSDYECAQIIDDSDEEYEPPSKAPKVRSPIKKAVPKVRSIKKVVAMKAAIINILFILIIK